MTKPDFGKLLTIYGRKPVLEALQNTSIKLFRLHLADSNKSGDTINEIIALAETRKVDIQTHTKLSLSRISKNSQQDQGVALDIFMPGFMDDNFFIKNTGNSPFQLLALNNITNPQNLGMIIRSVCASSLAGIILPSKGSARLDSLVIKASAGTLFNANIIRCENLATTLMKFADIGAEICILDAKGKTSLFDYCPSGSAIYVLGNETDGITDEIKTLAKTTLKIPMNNNVESLNVAVTAGLVAFCNGAQKKAMR